MRIRSLVSNALLYTMPLLIGYPSVNAQENNNQTPQQAQEPTNPDVISKAEDKNIKESVFSYVLNKPQISQIRSSWAITEVVKYNASKTLTLSANDITVEYGDNEQFVSNSRSKPHSVPRASSAKFNLAEANPCIIKVISSSNDKQKCNEKIGVQINTIKNLQDLFEPTLSQTQFLPLELKQGDLLQITYTIEHEHFLYGTYDPLLGTRKFKTHLGPYTIYSTYDLNNEHNTAHVIPKLNPPQKERILNTETEPNDSPYKDGFAGRKGKFLVLLADVPGFQYFRFDDMPVRYGDRFELSFDYIIAHGSEGSCHVRIMEYQDTPNAWKRLDEGGFDEELGVEKQNNPQQPVPEQKKEEETPRAKQGRWLSFKKIITLTNDTTTGALDYRITGANVGELYIDMSTLKLKNLSCEDFNL